MGASASLQVRDDGSHLDFVSVSLKSGSKKQLLLDLAALLAPKAGVHERLISDILMERERLGSTGMGVGVAIPHGRLPGLDRVYEGFVKLSQPVDFDSIDNQPVDLVYLLLADRKSVV